MRILRPRLSVRALLGLVALIGALLWGWINHLDPVRRWKAAVRDPYDAALRSRQIDAAAKGQVRGLTADAAFVELLGLVEDRSVNPMVRWTSIEAMDDFGKGHSAEAIPRLVAALRRDGSPGVRMVAAVKLHHILGDKLEDGPVEREALAGYVAALTDPDRRVRRWSACCLG